MTTRIYKFRDIAEAQYFLNGAIFGGSVIPKPGAGFGQGGNPNNLFLGVSGLVGLTLIFSSPAAHTVTFTDSVQVGNPDPSTLMPSDVKTQIETAVAAVNVSFWGGIIVIQEKTPTSGVAITGAGTANATLGFDPTIGNTGKVYAPPGSANPAVAPAWVWAYSTNDNGHTVYTLE